MKYVIFVNNLDYLLLFLPGKIGKSLIKFPEKKPAPYYNNYKKRKFNKPSTSNNFSKKFKKPKKKWESKFEKYFHKENVSIVENHDILLIKAQNLPKRLNNKLML
jgi:hypothetical protein